MSERVVPTRRGWWFVSIAGEPEIIAWVHDDSAGNVFTAGIIEDHDVAEPVYEWLRPVPSSEAVQAAVDAMAQAKSAMKAWMRECEWRVFVANLDNAISGLTGGEGCDGESGHE